MQGLELGEAPPSLALAPPSCFGPKLFAQGLTNAPIRFQSPRACVQSCYALLLLHKAAVRCSSLWSRGLACCFVAALLQFVTDCPSGGLLHRCCMDAGGPAERIVESNQDGGCRHVAAELPGRASCLVARHACPCTVAILHTLTIRTCALACLS